MARAKARNKGNKNKKHEKGREPLSKDKILQTAMAYADEHGLEPLSMRKLGESLGVQAMSLYNHVANKDELLNGMLNLVFAKITVPENAKKWFKEMHQRAISARQVFLAHPWALTLVLKSENPTEAGLHYTNSTLGCLRQAGFSVELADHAMNTLDSYTYGFTLQELSYPFDMKEIKEVALKYLPMTEGSYPYLAEIIKHIAHRDYKSTYDGVHSFEFGLELILHGLEGVLKKKASP